MYKQEESQNSTVQNLIFNDQESAWATEIKSSPDETFNQTTFDNADLGDFLQRPVLLSQQVWPVGSLHNEAMNVWALWYDNPYVQNKIANYAFLKCNLNVKVILNGTQFHYSRALVSYEPLAARNDFAIYESNVVNNILTLRSQRPHFFLDPSCSQGGSIKLPFFSKQNKLRIYQRDDFVDMGELNIDAFEVLKHANNGTDSITVTTYAWASEVELTVPTVYEPQSFESIPYTPQGDEYTMKPSQRISAAILAVTEPLSKVPFIGQFALATSMMVKTVGSIAHMFGYSRPAIIDTIQNYKPRFFGYLANTDLPETVTKLSVYSKQETTIDPRVTGLSDIDELAINNICQKETFLTSFDWQINDAAQTLLYTFLVSPILYNLDSTHAGNEGIAHTPMSFVSSLFRYWSGTIKYRFQIVCTKFHKGRLKITYDPASPNVNSHGTDTSNIVFTRIVDISEKLDFEIDIDWAQHVAYKPTGSIVTSTQNYHGTTELSSLYNSFGNGYLTVEVLNELSAPTDGANISINVFVSTGDDFELAVPFSGRSDHEDHSWFPIPVQALNLIPEGEEPKEEEVPFTPQSQEGTIPIVDNDTDNAPESADAVEKIGNTNMNTIDKKPLVFFGERIVSLRTMAKRYCYSYSQFHDVEDSADSNMKSWIMEQNNYVLYRGHSPQGLWTKGVDNYNYCKNNMMTNLTPLFAGRRGSIRYKLFIQSNGQIPIRQIAAVRLMEKASGYVNDLVTTSTASSTNNTNARTSTEVASSMYNGSAIIPVEQQPVLEIDTPYYNNYRFYDCKNLTNQVANTHDDGSIRNNIQFIATGAFHNDDHANRSLSEAKFYMATGEDFNLFFFTGIPLSFYYSDDEA